MLLYGSIAAYGAHHHRTFLVAQGAWIRIVGGAFLFYLGLKALLKPPTERAANVRANSFPLCLLLHAAVTLTNPATIISFAAVFAGLAWEEAKEISSQRSLW